MDPAAGAPEPAAPAAPSAPAEPLPAPVPAAPQAGTPREGGPLWDASRAVLLVGAAGALAFAGNWALGLWAAGGVLGPLTLIATTVPLAAALAALALWPLRVAAALRAPGLATAGGLLAAALVGLTAYYVFGLGALVETAQALDAAAQGGGVVSPGLGGITRTALLVSLLISFALFTIPALVWAHAAEQQPGRAALRWLGLRRAGARRSLLWAGMAVLLVFWFLIAAGLASRAFGGGEPVNERAESIAEALDVPSALLVALLTGVGEELFFRGFLLRKVGNAPQAVLFGLAHLNYFQWLEVTVTAALGYMFGRAVQRTGNVWGPIVGHAAFNAVSLLILLFKLDGAFPA